MSHNNNNNSCRNEFRNKNQLDNNRKEDNQPSDKKTVLCCCWHEIIQFPIRAFAAAKQHAAHFHRDGYQDRYDQQGQGEAYCQPGRTRPVAGDPGKGNLESKCRTELRRNDQAGFPVTPGMQGTHIDPKRCRKAEIHWSCYGQEDMPPIDRCRSTESLEAKESKIDSQKQDNNQSWK